MAMLNDFKQMVIKKISRQGENLTSSEINHLYTAIERVKDVEILPQGNFTVAIVEGENFNRVIGVSKRNVNDQFSVYSGIDLALSRAAEAFMDEIYCVEIKAHQDSTDADAEFIMAGENDLMVDIKLERPSGAV